MYLKSVELFSQASRRLEWLSIQLEMLKSSVQEVRIELTTFIYPNFHISAECSFCQYKLLHKRLIYIVYETANR